MEKKSVEFGRLLFAIRKSQLRLGFTFIELLVSMMVILTVGTIVLAVFLSTLRGTEKSQRMNSVRQNGNFVLAQMAKTIRQASAIDNNDTCLEQESEKLVLISAKDQQKTTYACSIETQNITAQTDNESPVDLLGNSGDVKLANCRFTCGTQGVTPFVKVSFQLSPANIPNPGKTDVYDFTNTILLLNASGR